ncbi:FtsX-like permease family protein [Lysobacter lacus]|uniref:FtsX-like permease family protein n=2 Tax=Cognatilysobacter lacus TaxID=1643323 RepID=A0A5D8YWF2_9GAMM|nr:FtsX-like permease family protein [Lysobacter lacus]
MRSALTSLGVIIGIAAVIVMVSVGQGTQAEIDKLVSGLGSNRLDVSSGANRGMGGVRLSSGASFTLTQKDADAIRQEIPEVQYVAASLRGNTQLVFAENNASSQWQGVDADWFPINGWTLASGEPFSRADYSGGKSVIVGETVRRELFGEEEAVGQTVRMGRVPFTVVGVLKPKGQGGFGQDQDDIVVVPIETARRRLMGAMGLPAGAVMQIAVGVGDARDLDYAQGEIEALLRQRHKIQPGDEDDFNVRNIAEVVATRTQATRLMSLLLGAVASISLIVGGIGIMNIMLVSVTERIREIGLRMAVGAGPGDIQRQFLAEAMLISLIGGALGILIGIAGSLAVQKFGSLPVKLDARIILLAAGFSIATGLFFGFYPARKASRLDPIEALRQQ